MENSIRADGIVQVRTSILCLALLLTAAGGLSVLFLPCSDARAQESAERTGSDLRQQGFTTDPSEFASRTSAGLRDRADALADADLIGQLHTVEIRGPVMPFYSSNICQFDTFYSNFDSHGATLHAKLAELKGNYTIELKAPTGEHIRTFTGITTNGEIKADWDLTDGHGHKYTNDAFESISNVTLPGSGRSQIQKMR